MTIGFQTTAAKIVAVPLGAIADKGAGVWLIDQSTSTVTFRPVTKQGSERRRR